MDESCQGSLGQPGERPPAETFLPTARCDVCGYFVEIHPTNPEAGPYSEDAWRLEMHDTAGRTIHLEQNPNPAADCIVARKCKQCGSSAVELTNAAPDLRVTCSQCGYAWVTGHLNS
jgi:hypothetical protein